ncbi:MAG: hypothetical protein JSS83_29020 [Cyanobacteria bacterium SZAS LIN-3]|nr:hypothetical protein [Cyanobacteria bacterium SZAS LIN-3]
MSGPRQSIFACTSFGPAPSESLIANVSAQFSLTDSTTFNVRLNPYYQPPIDCSANPGDLFSSNCAGDSGCTVNQQVYNHESYMRGQLQVELHCENWVEPCYSSGQALVTTYCDPTQMPYCGCS